MNPDTRDKLAFRRRIALLALLHRSPQTYDEIISALDRQDLLNYDREEDHATIVRLQKYQFRYDQRTLRQIGYVIVFDRRSKRYCWNNSPFGLSLSPTQLEALALLCHTFAHSTFPHSHDLRELLTFLVERLSPTQQEFIENHRDTFSIDLREATDYSNADPETIREIKKAIQRTQQLAFTYRAPRQGKERRHVIEPRPLVFKERHTYLYGRAIEGNRELQFRLDHIVPGSAKMLSNKFTHASPFVSSYTLRYWLSPTLARNGVSEHFSEQRVESHADGSATVTAHTDNLFEARRIFLGYGVNCIVLEPPELVAEMRQVRDHFNTSYPTPSE